MPGEGDLDDEGGIVSAVILGRGVSYDRDLFRPRLWGLAATLEKTREWTISLSAETKKVIFFSYLNWYSGEVFENDSGSRPIK